MSKFDFMGFLKKNKQINGAIGQSVMSYLSILVDKYLNQMTKNGNNVDCQC